MGQDNFARLKKSMRRAAEGRDVTLGFFGGSITQGCSATDHKNSYAWLVFEWWEQAFPQSKPHYVNGGIGGTTSHFGVSRVWEDLLAYRPDVVVVDFSVNDKEGEETFFQETYEGVIRRILAGQAEPAVLVLNNVYYDTGANVQECHNQVADWYHIPYVSMKDTVYQRMKAGIYKEEELTEDGLHPGDKGHQLVAAELIALLEEVKAHMWEGGEEVDFPEPMTANAYENARRLTIFDVSPKLDGFLADTAEKQGHLDLFKNGWVGRKAGDKIVFEEEASCIAVQYRRTIAGPALRARLTLGSGSGRSMILDGNFEEGWGDCAQLTPILHHGERKRYRIELEILADGQEDAVPFYLMSLVIA